MRKELELLTLALKSPWHCIKGFTIAYPRCDGPKSHKIALDFTMGLAQNQAGGITGEVKVRQHPSGAVSRDSRFLTIYDKNFNLISLNSQIKIIFNDINDYLVAKQLVEQISGKIVGLTIKASKLPELYI